MLMTIKDVSKLLALSSRQCSRLRDSGQMPPPVKIGGRSVRWRNTDLEAWVEAGCPDVRKTTWMPMPTPTTGCRCNQGGK